MHDDEGAVKYRVEKKNEWTHVWAEGVAVFGRVAKRDEDVWKAYIVTPSSLRESMGDQTLLIGHYFSEHNAVDALKSELQKHARE